MGKFNLKRIPLIASFFFNGKIIPEIKTLNLQIWAIKFVSMWRLTLYFKKWTY